MKKFTKILTAIATLSMATAIGFSFAACGGGGKVAVKDGVLEAENAVLKGEQISQMGGEPAPITVETGATYVDGVQSGPEVTNIGYFSTAGQSLTFTITSDKECDATIKLVAASANMGMTMEGEDWSTMKFVLNPVDLAAATTGANATIKLSNNGGDAIALTGTLPGLDPLDMSAPGAWRYMGEGTGTIHLVKGENVIVLELIGAGVGINVDKLVIVTDAKLTWKPTDNSDRIPSAGGGEEEGDDY